MDWIRGAVLDSCNMATADIDANDFDTCDSNSKVVGDVTQVSVCAQSAWISAHHPPHHRPEPALSYPVHQLWPEQILAATHGSDAIRQIS
jgi:hypothetical protein